MRSSSTSPIVGPLPPEQAASDASRAVAMMIRLIGLFVQAFDVFEGVRREVHTAGGRDDVAEYDRNSALLRDDANFPVDLRGDLSVEILTLLAEFENLGLCAALRRRVDAMQFRIAAREVLARLLEVRDRGLRVVLEALLVILVKLLDARAQRRRQVRVDLLLRAAAHGRVLDQRVADQLDLPRERLLPGGERRQGPLLNRGDLRLEVAHHLVVQARLQRR